MKAILVANPKGGAGKTTLSINLAGWLASTGERVSLLDLDRQKSATKWLARRPENLPPIKLMGEDDKSRWLIIDSPAGLHGKSLDHAVKLVTRILVPISPSLFDIQASQDFLAELAEEKKVRQGKIDIGVVGMRMAPRTRAAVTLEQFLKKVDLEVVAHLHETQRYVNAAFEGKTLFDLPPHLTESERESWAPLIRWLEH
ncbi:MAG: ParA family protein [Hydrogenophilaceae bacterium]|nr:ParA family protein [Hydrogenophilaceae bacterium]